MNGLFITKRAIGMYMVEEADFKYVLVQTVGDETRVHGYACYLLTR